MRRSLCLAVFLVGSSLVAQTTEPRVKKSLAAGLVRHCIERDGLTPPKVLSGVEIGTGKGAMVLMIRRRDGSLHAEALPRGLGNHGPAAEVQEVTPMIEEEEQVVPRGKAKPKPAKPKVAKPEAAKPEAAKPKAVKPNPKQAWPKPERLVKPKQAAPVSTAKLAIKRHGGTVSVTTTVATEAIRGDQVDRVALAKQMQKCFASTKGSKVEGQIILEASVDATMQDVLTCWELAMAAGFSTPMFSPRGGTRPATREEQDMLSSLPEKFKWQSRGNGPVPIYDGELLILLDGPTRFGDVVPLLIQCAHKGIWQIAFVGEKDAKTRFKLPTHLPADG